MAFRSSLVRLVVLIAAAVLLTGCIKMRVGFDVKTDGSTDVSIAMGMTQEVKQLLGEEGTETDLSEMLGITDANNNVPIEKRTWVDGEYEWNEVKSTVPDFQMLNTVLSGGDNELFDEFTVTKETVGAVDRYTVRAVTWPWGDEISESLSEEDTMGMDPTEFVELQMMFRLPGKIIEANGYIVTDTNGSGIVWSISPISPTVMSAVSEVR